jgi:hypothetical protein
VTINTALIAEYMALATALDTDTPASEYRRANGLALRCMIELPSEVWGRVLAALQSPTWQGAIDLAVELRAGVNPGDPLVLERHAVYHAPGAGGPVAKH